MLLVNVPENIMLLVAVLQLVWLMLLSFFLIKTIRHYRHLIGKNKKQDLKNILEAVLAKVQQQDESTQTLNKRCEEIEKRGVKHLQKVGFLRFNPFSDTGGDQSFVLGLLDGEDNGVILSSLHGRETTRIYAKSIKKGEGDSLELSKEETEVVKRAKRRKI